MQWSKASRSILAVASGAAMAFAVSYASAEGPKNLEGIWRVTRMGVDCQSGQQRPPFSAIMSFGRDGSYTGYAVPPFSPPASGSPEYGTWKHEPGARNYSFRFLSNNYDDSGAFDGTTEVTGAVQVAAGGDAFSYTAVVDFFDANGDPLFSACGKATGTRFE